MMKEFEFLGKLSLQNVYQNHLITEIFVELVRLRTQLLNNQVTKASDNGILTGKQHLFLARAHTHDARMCEHTH